MTDEFLDLFAEYLEKQDVLTKLTQSDKLDNFSQSEIHTLVAINDLDTPNVTSIAQKMKMTKGAISKIIKKLIKSGAIKSYQLPTNKQKIFYDLTAYGVDLYNLHAERHKLWLERDKKFLLAHSDEELEFLQNFMINFNKYLEEQIQSYEEQQTTNKKLN